MSIISLTNGNKGQKEKSHDDPNPQGSTKQDIQRPPDQPDGRAGGQGVGGPHSEPPQGHRSLIPGQRNQSRRYRHEGESQEREDRPEIMERPDEFPRLWAEAHPVGKQGIQEIQSKPFTANREG